MHEFEIAFGAFHVVFEIGKGHFRLDHPKFGQMARGVGVFCAEGRAKGIDVGEGAGQCFPFELSGDGEIGRFVEKILRVSRLCRLQFRELFKSKRRDSELLAAAFAVGAGDDGRLDVEKALLAERIDGWQSARALRTRRTAPCVLVRGRRWAMVRKNSNECRFFCRG